MVTATEQQYTREVHMEPWSDDDKALLTQAIQTMRNDKDHPKWTQPPLKLQRAEAAILQGRVRPTYPRGLYHITGNSDNHTVDAERCTCDGYLKGKTLWCTHRTAVEAYRRYEELKADQPQWSVTLPPHTIEERLATVPDDEEAIHCTEEEPPVQTTTDESLPEPMVWPTKAEPIIEAPGSLLEPPRTPQALRLTPRPISAIIVDLSRPLPPECIDTLTKGGAPIAFLHWHTVAAVLDAYAPGWHGAVVRVEKIGEKCAVTYRLTIPAAEGLCSREDSGMEDEDKDDYGDAMTNAIATAFKRAAAKFGLGRWLYDKKEHTDKFVARLRGDREQLLKTLEETATGAGVPFATLLPWLMSQTGAYHRSLIPVWALRSLLAQLQRQEQTTA